MYGGRETGMASLAKAVIEFTMLVLTTTSSAICFSRAVCGLFGVDEVLAELALAELQLDFLFFLVVGISISSPELTGLNS